MRDVSVADEVTSTFALMFAPTALHDIGGGTGRSAIGTGRSAAVQVVRRWYRAFGDGTGRSAVGTRSLAVVQGVRQLAIPKGPYPLLYDPHTVTMIPSGDTSHIKSGLLLAILAVI